MTEWTTELTDRVRALRLDGYSAARIAVALAADGIHKTRNSIISRLHRVGEYGGAEPHVTLPRYKPLARSFHARAVKSPPAAAVEANGACDQTKPCRWPIGDPTQPGFRFCDAPSHVTRGRKKVRSYCAAHCALAYEGFRG